MTLRTSSNQDHSKHQARAEALFRKQEQQREGEKAMAEYVAQREAVRERTARLRALRLAREAEAKKQQPISEPERPPI
jgi:hypothetical protein